jgi:hypothetical protein
MPQPFRPEGRRTERKTRARKLSSFENNKMNGVIRAQPS